MRFLLATLLCLSAAGCGNSARQAKLDRYFVEWLEHHGEKSVVTDSHGVGLAGNATRLKASIYGSEKHDTGGHTVETEFRIKLPSGQEIVEFVAGMGDEEEKALDDSLANFTLTTFHVVYKCFLNPADPHQEIKRLSIQGKDREIAPGDIYLRGTQEADKIDLNSVRPGIEQAIANMTLSDGPHWIKIVYSQSKGQPLTVAVTLDNNDDTALTASIQALDWPKTDEFYMAKQFIVIK